MIRTRTWIAIASLALLAMISSGCGTLDLTGSGISTSGEETTATEAAPPIIVGSGDLTLRLLAPQDGDIFDVPDILVVGEAGPGIVLSVNDSLAVADERGRFAIPMHLEEGTNLLELVASNESGDQISTTLVVSYEPPG